MVKYSENIQLKYVPVYDANLTLASGAVLTDEETAEGYSYLAKMEEEWKEASKVLDYYASLGFRFPDKTPAYLVHPRGTFTPFADPLTLHITPDLSDTITTLVHEYCHVFFLYPENDALAEKIWNTAQKAFSTEDFVTQDHIIINKLTEAGLYQLWGKERTDTVLAKERTLEGLKRAWEIWDESKIQNGNPIEAVLELCAQQPKK